MAQVLLYSDIHIYPHKRSSDRLEDCLKAQEWVFETALERRIKDVIFGGDLLHERQKIESYTYMRTFLLLQKYMERGDIRLWLLLGNHDLWFAQKWSVSSVFAYSALPNLTIIDRVCSHQIGGAKWDFIPYTHDPIGAVAQLTGGGADYCLGHIALHGARLNSSGTHADVVIEHDGDMVAVDHTIFRNYRHTFLGHYHSAQVIGGNVEYIGSPLQLSFGEAHEKKHIIVLDTKTGRKEYVENDFSPRHLYVRQKDVGKHDLKGNFVCVLADEDVSSADVVKLRKDLIENQQVATLQIRPAAKKAEEHVIVDAKAILLKEDEMLERYISEAGADGLGRDRLLHFGKKIIAHKTAASV